MGTLGGQSGNTKTSGTAQGLVFPTKTSGDESEPYICITAAYEEEGPLKGQTQYELAVPTYEIKGSVVLPMPNAIQDAQGHLWSEYSITDSVQEMLNAGAGVTGGALQKLTSGLGSVAGLVESNGAASKLSRRTTGVGIDPNTRLEYTGEALREFTFNFTLLPESQKDADAIRNIVKFFRIFGTGISTKTSGELAGTVTDKLSGVTPDNVNAFIKEPHVFIINFANPHLNDMLMPIDCVLVNFSTSFFEDGYASFFYDGMPKKVSLSMTFKERYTLYAQDWMKSVPSSIAGDNNLSAMQK